MSTIRERQHFVTAVGMRFTDPSLHVTVTRDETMISEDLGWGFTCRGCGTSPDFMLPESETTRRAKDHAATCTGVPVDWTPPASSEPAPTTA